MRLPEPMGPSLSDCVKNLTLCVPIIVLKCAFQWGAFVSLEKGSENKNTCSWLLREESVYIKKMSLSLDYFCLRRATVCYSGLIWSCCGFLEFSPHIPYSGSFNLFLWWCKEYVKQSCKNMLIMLVSWYYFLVGANFWGRHAKKFWRNSCLQTLTTLSILVSNTNNPNTKHSGNRAWLISKFYVPKRKCKWYHELVGSH